MIDNVKQEVIKLLDKDNSGYGMDHINRVFYKCKKNNG